MKLKNALLFGLFVISACVTSSSAQVFWSNQSTAKITDDIWCVTYANGTFAAVTNQGNLLTSADGMTWSSQSIDSGVLLVSIAYGNGTWVAVGAGGVVLVSSDLKTWAAPKSITTNKLNGVAYGGGIWCAVGDGATVITSPDALNWTIQPVPSDLNVTGFLHGIIYAAASSAVNTPSPVAGFIFCGATTGNGAISGPGVALFMPVVSGLPGTVGFMPSGSETSSNLEAIDAANGIPIIYGGVTEGDLYQVVAVGWGVVVEIPDSVNGASLLYSSVPNVVYRGLAYGDGYWVAAGELGTILSSTDAFNWTQRFSGDSPSTVTTATLLSAAYSEQLQRFVVTGTGGTVLVSNAAPTVFGNVSTRGYVSSSQTFIGGFFVSGTAPRNVLIRGDGPVLSIFSVPNPLPDPVLTVFNSSGAVVSTNAGWTANSNPSTISAAAQQVGAFALPNPSADAALLLTLQPGAYTVQITSAKGNSGIALFEAYTN